MQCRRSIFFGTRNLGRSVYESQQRNSGLHILGTDMNRKVFFAVAPLVTMASGVTAAALRQ